VIPALGRIRQEDPEFEGSLGYIVSSRSARQCSLKKKKKRRRRWWRKGRKGKEKKAKLDFPNSQPNYSLTSDLTFYLTL
jgi:hypothetical protein